MHLLTPVLWGFTFAILLSANLSGQGTSIPEGNQAYHILDRLAIKGGVPSDMHMNTKPYLRGDATRYAYKVYQADSFLSKKDRYDLQYIFDDNNEWLSFMTEPATISGPRNTADMALESRESEFYRRSRKPVFKALYKTPANFFEVNTQNFHFRLNPILNGQIGQGKGSSNDLFLNRRGMELRGAVDDRVFFQFNLWETQAAFPRYVNDYIRIWGAPPGVGNAKRFTGNVIPVSNGYDFVNSQAYVGFNATRHVGVQFGHGRHNIGNGYRSLLLSDFANNYFFLKLNWRVWKFQLQNIFAELAGPRETTGDRLFPKKYMANHHFSYNITPNLNFGFFETVIFARNNQPELQYLNPVILYRTVEFGLGSPDNILIGLDGKWNFLKRFQWYGQLILDEFKFSEITAGDGWWGNKVGYQTGLKYIDVAGVDHLDFQFEINAVRPYTYTHFDSSSNYTHYRQPLAHPLGANFREYLILLKYQPTKRLFMDFRFIHMITGDDQTNKTNFGTNINLANELREMDYGNEIGQGIGATSNLLGVVLSYRLFHNCFLDFQYFQRKKNSENVTLNRDNTFIGGGIRLNAGLFKLDF